MIILKHDYPSFSKDIDVKSWPLMRFRNSKFEFKADKSFLILLAYLTTNQIIFVRSKNYVTLSFIFGVVFTQQFDKEEV